MTQLSIVIPHSGEREILAKLLQALRDQSCDPLEVIVVCNGQRSSIEYRNFDLQTRFPVRFLDSKLGANSARNAGWASSLGNWILFLDDDCIPEGCDFLSTAVNAIDGIGCPFGGIYKLPPASSCLQRAYYQVQMSWLESYLLKDRAYHLLGGVMCFPRDLLEVFPFSEEWIFGGTELEHQIRLYLGGVEMRMISSLEVTHLCKVNFASLIRKAIKQGIGSRAAIQDVEGPPQYEKLRTLGATQINWLDSAFAHLYHFFFRVGARYYEKNASLSVVPTLLVRLICRMAVGSVFRSILAKYKNFWLVINLKRNQIQHETWKRWKDRDRS